MSADVIDHPTRGREYEVRVERLRGEIVGAIVASGIARDWSVGEMAEAMRREAEAWAALARGES